MVRFCRLIKLSRTTQFGFHPVVPSLSAVNFYPKAGVFSWSEDGHKHMLNVHVPLEEDLEVYRRLICDFSIQIANAMSLTDVEVMSKKRDYSVGFRT